MSPLARDATILTQEWHEHCVTHITMFCAYRYNSHVAFRRGSMPYRTPL